MEKEKREKLFRKEKEKRNKVNNILKQLEEEVIAVVVAREFLFGVISIFTVFKLKTLVVGNEIKLSFMSNVDLKTMKQVPWNLNVEYKEKVSVDALGQRIIHRSATLPIESTREVIEILINEGYIL